MNAMKRSALLVAILSVFMLAPPAHGQWSFVNNFSTTSNINCVYFLDAVGVPTTGFVGVGGEVYRTVNGATTWTKVLTFANGWPTGFAFKNASIGWCCVNGLQNTPAIYKTINGGLTWTPLSPLGIASDVRYNAAKGWLFLSTHQSNAQSLVSADDGATWGPINSSVDENGFAFCDSLHGLLTAHAFSFFTTNDGGLLWKILGFGFHSWSPAAIPGTTTFVGAEDLTSKIHASTDAGLTWFNAGTIPGILTGCVQTGPCNVYVQSSTGIYNSSDLSTWALLPGSPRNQGADTRFFVGTNMIYAGDGSGNLYSRSALGGGWPTLTVSPHSFSFSLAAGCGPKHDTATFINHMCLPLTILSASVIDSNIWSFNPNQPLPLTLSPGDTARIAITARDDSAGTFHDQLRLWLKTLYGTTDTVIVLNLDAAPMSPPTLRATSISLPNRCTAADTVFSIRNNNCDTIQIASLSMLDTDLFNLLPISLPMSIATDSQVVIPISAFPKHKGTFADTVKIILKANGFTLDTTLVLHGTVGSSAIAAHLSSDSIRFDTVFECNTKLDTIYLRNNSCDSFQITQASIGGKPFVLVDTLVNKWIASGDSVPIIIALYGSSKQGDYSDEIGLILNNGGSQKSVLIPMTGSVRATPMKVFVSTDVITVDSISACSVFDTAILITAQTGCDSISITSVTYSGTGAVNITASPAFPRVLHTSDTEKFNISYSPSGTGAVGGIIHIKGIGIDTTITLHISIRDDAQPVLLSMSRTSFSARPCDLDSATITVSNSGCVPVTLNSLSFCSAPSHFSIATFKLPLTIPADSTLSTKIYFSGDGSIISPIRDTIVTLDATGHNDSVAVAGTIIPIDTVRVGIALNAGSTVTPIAGGMTSPLLFFNDAVSASSGLQSMHCIVKFNGNVLTEVGSASGLSGWNVQETSSLGVIDMICTRSNGSIITSGQPIASVQFQTSLSDSVSTPIALTNVTFSPSDPTYEQCTLASAVAPASIEIQLAPQCGDSNLVRALRQEPLLTSVSVFPQESDLLVTFRSQVASGVTIALRDVLGRIHYENVYPAVPGMNTLTLSTSNLEEGIYFVEIGDRTERIIKQVAILH